MGIYKFQGLMVRASRQRFLLHLEARSEQPCHKFLKYECRPKYRGNIGTTSG